MGGLPGRSDQGTAQNLGTLLIDLDVGSSWHVTARLRISFKPLTTVRNVRLPTDDLPPTSWMLARWFGSIEDSGEVPLGGSTEGSGTLGEK